MSSHNKAILFFFSLQIILLGTTSIFLIKIVFSISYKNIASSVLIANNGPPKTPSKVNPGLKLFSSFKLLYIFTLLPSLITKLSPSFHDISEQLPTQLALYTPDVDIINSWSLNIEKYRPFGL